jgi:hypothetical protein
MPDTLRTYKIQFKNDKHVTIRAVKIEHGRIFGKDSLVITGANGVEETAYLPFDDILYVVPTDLFPSTPIAF